LAAKNFQFRLITPQGKLMDAPAAAAVLPAHDGQLGVLPSRAPMVVKLGMGALRVDLANATGTTGGSREYLIEDGFAQMVDNRLTILTARATSAETITETDAQAELTAAEARKPAKQFDQDEAARIKKDRTRARLKLGMAKQFKSRGGAI
jgi:F-type H+-transporting ATPase subunit epsilon